MIPKILFRAKRKSDGKWLEGFYVQDALQANSLMAAHAIQKQNTYPDEIEIQTLGQYRQGIDAFDGDWIQGSLRRDDGEVIEVEGALSFDGLNCVLETNIADFPLISVSKLTYTTIKKTGKNIYDYPELVVK